MSAYKSVQVGRAETHIMFIRRNKIALNIHKFGKLQLKLKKTWENKQSQSVNYSFLFFQPILANFVYLTQSWFFFFFPIFTYSQGRFAAGEMPHNARAIMCKDFHLERLQVHRMEGWMDGWTSLARPSGKPVEPNWPACCVWGCVCICWWCCHSLVLGALFMSSLTYVCLGKSAESWGCWIYKIVLPTFERSCNYSLQLLENVAGSISSEMRAESKVKVVRPWSRSV